MPILYSGEHVARHVSFLGVPLVAQKCVTGALLLTRKGGGFAAGEVNALRVLCNQAAAAIENARVYERLEELAATDALTGLFNRRSFEEAFAREIARVERGEKSVALLLLDIDHFKGLNDTYGHTMGNLVLRQVADVLRAALRRGDILARFGGEEFVILLPSSTARGASGFAERVRKAVATASLHPGGGRKKVTVSVGWALFPEDADSGETLIVCADRALYAAKEMGRNKVVAFEAVASAVGPGEASP